MVIVPTSFGKVVTEGAHPETTIVPMVVWTALSKNFGKLWCTLYG